MLPTTILVGTDGSDTASAAVKAAIDLAGALPAVLHIVTAYKEMSALAASEPVLMATFMVDSEWREATVREARQVLDRAVKWAEEAGVQATGHAVAGPAADAIVSVARSVGADLIVVGDRGMNRLRRFLGASVPNSVAHEAPCSVWIVNTVAQVRAATV